MDKRDRRWLFERAGVPRAVAELAAPTVLSQLISLFYNMADTFFVGRTGSAEGVAAVSLAAPVMLTLTALANLFGMGAAAVMARSLGAKDPKKAGHASAFGFWAALAAGLGCSLLSLLLPGPLLSLLGAEGGLRAVTGDYLALVFTLGAAPALVSSTLAHLLRADGAPRQASLGLTGGGILNLILDPLFIFDWGLGLGISGAAAATLLANVLTMGWFLWVLRRRSRRGETAVSLRPSRAMLRREVSLSALGDGLPGMLQTLLASVSNACLNRLASDGGSQAVAALGIVKKLDTVPMNVTIGLSQGVLPLLGYSASAGDKGRMRAALRWTLGLSVGVSLLCVGVFELCPGALVRLFLDEAATAALGARFLRVICLSTPLMAVGFTMITLFQATGRKKQGVVLSLCRKGLLDIPLMFLLHALVPVYGLVFVQPITECAAMAVALLLYARYLRETR